MPKQKLSERRDKSEIFQEAEGAVACTVEGVEPRSSQIAKLADDLVSQFLGEGEV